MTTGDGERPSPNDAGGISGRLWRWVQRAPVTLGLKALLGGVAVAVMALLIEYSVFNRSAPAPEDPESRASGAMEFVVQGDPDQFVDFDVPEGQPPVVASALTDGADLRVNLDAAGRIRADGQLGDRPGELRPLGQAMPEPGVCAENTNWTAASADLLQHKYLCVRTTEGIHVVVSLEDSALRSQPPTARFRLANP